MANWPELFTEQRKFPQAWKAKLKNREQITALALGLKRLAEFRKK